MNFINYVVENYGQILERLFEHIQLTTVAVILAIVIAIPLGILISHFKKTNKIVLGIANVIQAIPSMALLGFAVPLLGIGYKPAIIVVILYSLLPIIKNTYIGLESINPSTLEASRGIGLTKLQVLFKVKLPLALPVIMAGVRISAVTAVGLMTLAAFIGGGGLGYLVFAGIRTLNTYQILAGAIPACLLALFVDYIGAVIENIVTPDSFLPRAKRTNHSRKIYQKVLLGGVAFVLLASFVVSGIKSRTSYAKELAIGCKDYTEQVLFCHLVAEAIESNTDIFVKRHVALGGTQVTFGALQAGDIDLYVEYSGTAYGNMLKHSPISDVQIVYETVRKEFKEKYQIEVLQQMQVNNTWTLAVRPDTAQQYNLQSISDLSRIARQMTVAAGEEFLERQDALPGLEKKYGFEFGAKKAVNGSLRYSALDGGSVDIIDAFATEGLLKKYGLVVLEDDEHFFLPYYAMPIMRTATYEQYPELEPILDQLGNLLTNSAMMELNYQVDELRREPKEVAKQFLIDHGMAQ